MPRKPKVAKVAKVAEEAVVPIEAVLELAEQSQDNIPQEEPKQQEGPKEGQVQVNVDLLRTFRPHFCTPCYGGMMTESTFMSYIKWANTAKELGLQWTLETMTNESLVTRARNTLTAKFLAMPEATHLFWVDADIGFEPWHVLVLLNRNVDMIGGLYPMKCIPLKWVVNGFDGAEEGPDGLQEVSKTGTGFLCVKRQVFDMMKRHPATKNYKNDIGLDPVYDQYLFTFWDTAVREGRYLSEDWVACSNFRDVGGKVWVDKRVLLRHAGSYNFSMESQMQVMNSIGPMFVEQEIKAGKVQLVDQIGNVLITT